MICDPAGVEIPFLRTTPAGVADHSIRAVRRVRPCLSRGGPAGVEDTRTNFDDYDMRPRWGGDPLSSNDPSGVADHSIRAVRRVRPCLLAGGPARDEDTRTHFDDYDMRPRWGRDPLSPNDPSGVADHRVTRPWRYSTPEGLPAGRQGRTIGDLFAASTSKMRLPYTSIPAPTRSC